MTIGTQEYQERLTRLQQRIASEGLDLFIVSAEESILYLTGVSYIPLERPFFILVRPRGEPELEDIVRPQRIDVRLNSLEQVVGDQAPSAKVGAKEALARLLDADLATR